MIKTSSDVKVQDIWKKHVDFLVDCHDFYDNKTFFKTAGMLTIAQVLLETQSKEE